jgi:hypothetical protein
MLSIEAQYQGWSGKIGGLLEYAANGSNSADRINAAGDDVNQTFLEVEAVALKYGVQLTRKPN